jgi:SUMO ligase MMS21 Smc5/6 complex component
MVQKFQQNPEEFNEKELKRLTVTNAKSQIPYHPKYDELVELIDNARNGVTNDLVMDDQPQNQVSKCPITQKPIQNPLKNADCGHVYEREAIMQFTKGKSGIKR